MKIVLLANMNSNYTNEFSKKYSKLLISNFTTVGLFFCQNFGIYTDDEEGKFLFKASKIERKI